MIVVVDSGVANLASVMAALRRLGVTAEISSDADVIRNADKVILPGVGSAAAAMKQLQDKKLIDVLRGLTQPTMGICLGMQLMFTSSEEGTQNGAPLPCLNLIEGEVKRLPAASDKPIPHMGWNNIRRARGDHPLLHGVDDEAYVYYVHSFAVLVGDTSVAATDYSAPFTAIAAYRNFYGCQFHPERSGAVGSLILQNFIAMRP